MSFGRDLRERIVAVVVVVVVYDVWGEDPRDEILG